MQTFKQKRIGAKKGYDLLKRKSDALKKAFNDIMKKIVQTKKKMGKEFNECLLEMAQANFAAGDFGNIVRDSVKTKTNVRLQITTENVAGMQNPTFHLRGGDDGDEDQILGLTGGGQAIMKARERFKKYLKLLIEIATLQTQYIAMERVIKITNRRVNALEFFIIPAIENTIKWIESELDELDREDFYRLKCVQDKKAEAALIEEQEQEERKHKESGNKEKTDEDKKHEDIFDAMDESTGFADENTDIIF